MLLNTNIPPYFMHIHQIPARIHPVQLADGVLVARRVVGDHRRPAEAGLEVLGACALGGGVVGCLENGGAEVGEGA